MTVLAPPNTTATVHVPARSKEVVTLDGQPPEKVEGVKFLRFVEGRAVYEIGSGRYEFISKP
jgi:alpha-L-rhamnosidase